MRRATLHALRPLEISSDVAPKTQGAERLIGLGFRYWVAGYKSGDIDRWEDAWRIYSHALGPNAARTAVSELSAWVRAVSAAARREIEVRHGDCDGFCRDESLALSMIAACQHNTCPAMRACAFALIESSLIDEVVHHAETFAVTMRGLDQVLPPALIVNAAAYASAPREMALRQ
ncbi:hypothetical protein [Hyphomicrobium sp. CS1GBMeth3]|uniref:hypothetical protein n=1 Tax=Hyphomicrobium sp. CS1GBMeth3 TaxID=1892845 RepID=UPI000931BCBC|nr:hypothetical protein [Hyphomicrobium sp. CS1GBMeth3]